MLKKNESPDEGGSIRNILLKVSYTGTEFCGWQKQDNFRTVQGEIEKALERIHHKPVCVFGSGRTDSGVHAAGQYCNFYSDIKSMEPGNYISALNSLLPKDVRITGCRIADKNFHARFDAKSRTYRYFIHTGKNPLPMELPFTWAIYKPLNLSKLNDMASLLHGEMDFTAFASSKDQSISKSRYIYNAVFFPQGENVVVFEITANAFLWRMVRSLTGTMVELESAPDPKMVFQEILESSDRAKAGATAPPQGLFLWDVSYFN